MVPNRIELDRTESNIFYFFFGFCSGGKWEVALQLLELMPTENLKADLTTYNSCLNAFVKVGGRVGG